MSKMPDDAIDAEIVEENKAVVLGEIKYPVNIIDLEILLDEYKDIPDINPDADEDLVGEQYQFVMKGHKAFVKARTSIDKTRKQLKQPALDYGRRVDSIAKEFQAMIIQTENKLQLQRKKVEDNEARKQREAEEAEEARIHHIKGLILSVKNLPLQHLNSNSEALTKALESLVVIDKEIYEEFFDEAVENQNHVISQLQLARENCVHVEQAIKIREEQEAEAKRLQDIEDAKLQAERNALAEQQAEFQRQKDEFANQQRAIQEENNRIEAERQADDLMRKQEAERVERERVEAEEREKQIAEEAYEARVRQKRNKVNLENAKSETRRTILSHYEAEEFCFNVDEFIEAVINNEVPNIKWVQDE